MPQVNPIQVGAGAVFATPAELITKALQDIGVVGFGMAATASEINSGLMTLNAMLDMWGVLRENISLRTSENFSIVVGQGSYGIGLGSNDFDTQRPIKIEQAWFRDASGIDLPPLKCTMPEAEYSALAVKDVEGIPTKLFYKPASPFGLIYFNTVPNTALTLYMNSWKPFAKITDPNDITALSYPDGFEAAILFNLEKLLCPPNKKSCPAEILEAAIISLQGIQAAYGETPTITNWDMPSQGGNKSSFFSPEG